MNERVPKGEELPNECNRILRIMETSWDGEGVVKLCSALLASSWLTYVKPDGDGEMLDGVLELIRDSIKAGREGDGRRKDTN